MSARCYLINKNLKGYVRKRFINKSQFSLRDSWQSPQNCTSSDGGESIKSTVSNLTNKFSVSEERASKS